MKIALQIAGFLVLALLVYGLIAGVLANSHIRTGKGLASAAKPFEHMPSNPRLKVLVIGDSSGVGVGAEPEQSVAGRLAKDYPNVSVTNQAVSGYRIHDLYETFRPTEKYDIIIIHIGGNDILHGTDRETAEKELREVLDRARSSATHVVHINGGDMGNAPIFIWPSSYLMTYRTKKYRDIFMRVDGEMGIVYVDIYQREEDGGRGNGPERSWFAADAFHPSASSYAFWYESILDELQVNTDLDL